MPLAARSRASCIKHLTQRLLQQMLPFLESRSQCALRPTLPPRPPRMPPSKPPRTVSWGSLEAQLKPKLKRLLSQPSMRHPLRSALRRGMQPNQRRWQLPTRSRREQQRKPKWLQRQSCAKSCTSTMHATKVQPSCRLRLRRCAA